MPSSPSAPMHTIVGQCPQGSANACIQIRQKSVQFSIGELAVPMKSAEPAAWRAIALTGGIIPTPGRVQRSVAARLLVVGGLAAASCLGRHADAWAQQAPFTIADPASSGRAFSLDTSVSHAPSSTIVPRLSGQEPPPAPALHDSLTGARTEEFGTAYSYANPLYSTSHTGTNGVGEQGGGGGGRSAVISFVVARFGGPRPPLPMIPGIDPSTAPPNVALIRYGMEADAASFPDTASADVIDLAMHSMGRARTTQIDITLRHPVYGAGRDALLRQVALALVHQGAHPAAILSDGRRVLPRGPAERGTPVPGHLFSLVLTGGS